MNASKELSPYSTFFQTNVTLLSAHTWFSTSAEEGFLSIPMLLCYKQQGGNF